jgi:hypothetical protein
MRVNVATMTEEHGNNNYFYDHNEKTTQTGRSNIFHKTSNIFSQNSSANCRLALARRRPFCHARQTARTTPAVLHGHFHASARNGMIRDPHMIQLLLIILVVGHTIDGDETPTAKYPNCRQSNSPTDIGNTVPNKIQRASPNGRSISGLPKSI